MSNAKPATDTLGAAVSATGVSKSYPTPDGDLSVLDGLDLEVGRGEIVAITGESGAGKSTLLHLLGGLDQPSSGRIVVDGVDLLDCSAAELAKARNRRVGFVFQFHHLLPDFTAIENVAMPMLMMGSDAQAARDRARELLAQVSLDKRLEHRPSELSGGEQQRVAVARALANRPAVVLADEPSGNLDHRHSEQLHDLIWSLAQSSSASFVIATHDSALSRRADREIRLADGAARELSQAP
jgi:lipoprotein-releasing system ATP-binding protein